MDALTGSRLPAPAPAGAPPAATHADQVARRRRRWRAVAWVQLVVLTVISVGVLWLPAPFLLHHPGVVIDATQQLEGPQITDPSFGQGGQFLLTTQRTTPLTWGGYLWFSARLPVAASIVSIPIAAPRSHYESLAAMDQSKDVAAAVANCVVHGCAPEPVGVRVVAVNAGGPAARAGLQAGDVIVAATRLPSPRAYAGDEAAPAMTSLSAILNLLEFAETAAPTSGSPAVGVDVVREGEVARLSITSDGGPLGADIVTAWVAQRPLEVDTGQVGGPSTGLMLALTLIDAMTDGDLTGGRRVAGTGTIAPDGSVGPVGGVRAKVAGAVRAGADVFLVPPINARAARRAARRVAPLSLDVVEVRTLDLALYALCDAGGTSTACLPALPPHLRGRL